MSGLASACRLTHTYRRCVVNTWGAAQFNDRHSYFPRTITDMRCVELGPVSAPVYTGTSVDAARAFPMGVPTELRSRLNALGISFPSVEVSEEERRRMIDQFTAALLAD